MNVWDPERVVDETLARALLREQFPDLALESVEPLGVGWDVTVYLVDGTWAVRFPRREVAVPTLLREIALLPALAPRLPLPVPVPQLVGRPTDDFPWTFWGARMVPGIELADSGLTDGQRAVAARDVGEFLAVLHDPAVALMHGADLPHDPMRRALPSTRGPMTRDFLDKMAARGSWEKGSVVDRAVDEVLAAGQPLGAPAGEPVLVHGDLHLRHLLVTPEGAAAGIIDWGDACLADPALDLSLAYAAFSGASRVALFEAYGAEPDEARELRARVLALCMCAALADHADQNGMPRMLAEALAGLARAAA